MQNCGAAIHLEIWIFFVFHAHLCILLNEAFGQASLEPRSAPLKALLRWWWKDLSNGITHRDKCFESDGSSHLPPACFEVDHWSISQQLSLDGRLFGGCFVMWDALDWLFTHWADLVFLPVSTCVSIFYLFLCLQVFEVHLCPGTETLAPSNAFWRMLGGQ